MSEEAGDVSKALAAFGAPSIRYHSFGQAQVRPSSIVLPRRVVPKVPKLPAVVSPAPLPEVPETPPTTLTPEPGPVALHPDFGAPPQPKSEVLEHHPTEWAHPLDKDVRKNNELEISSDPFRSEQPSASDRKAGPEPIAESRSRQDQPVAAPKTQPGSVLMTPESPPVLAVATEPEPSAGPALRPLAEWAASIYPAPAPRPPAAAAARLSLAGMAAADMAVVPAGEVSQAEHPKSVEDSRLAQPVIATLADPAETAPVAAALPGRTLVELFAFLAGVSATPTARSAE